MTSLNPRCKLADNADQTILFETNFLKSKITTRRPIRWEEINFPNTWVLNSVISQDQLANQVTNEDFSHISQTSDGQICIQFEDKTSVYNRQSFLVAVD